MGHVLATVAAICVLSALVCLIVIANGQRIYRNARDEHRRHRGEVR